MAHLTNDERTELLNQSNDFRYNLLLQMDNECQSWLHMDSKQNGYLYTDNPSKEIAYMRELHHSLPENLRSDWLTRERIDDFAVQMDVSVRALLIPVNKAPREIVIDKDDDSLTQMQNCVEGLIERIDAYDDNLGIDIYVNEEGIYEHLLPNRAFFATENMEVAEYINPFSSSYQTIKEDELFFISLGNMLCIGHDSKTGEIASLDNQQIAFLNHEFEDPESGIVAQLTLKLFTEMGENEPPTRKDVQLIKDIKKEIEVNNFKELIKNPDLGDSHLELYREDSEKHLSESSRMSLANKAHEVDEAQKHLSSNDAPNIDLPFKDDDR